MTTAEELVEAARCATGLEDLGSTHFRAPLDAWAADLENPQLTSRGRSFLARLAVNNVRTRLQVLDLLGRHPEIADVELPPVVLIAGFARSGTTLLHNLLACHPRSRPLQRWELVRPVPPPTAATWATDPRRDEVQASVDALRGSDLERLHWVDAGDPEECPWGFYDATGFLGRGIGSVMRRWWDVVAELPSATFVEYRRLLQLLLWKNPPPPGAVLVLKSPTTTPDLARFDEAFPDARYVFTHRDPFRVVTSINAVSDAVALPLCVPGTRLGVDDGRGDRGALRAVVASAAAMRSFAAAHPERVTHVRYADLMADPIGPVRRGFRHLGIEADAEVLGGVEELLARQRAGGRPTPPAAYEHSYDVDDVWAEPTVAAYCSDFDVQRETHRLTEPKPRPEEDRHG